MATSNTGVIIKRSFQTAIPPALEPGELAYSYVSNTMFIGSPEGDSVLNVAGFIYTDAIDTSTPNNIPNTLVKRDANGNFYGILNTVDGLVPGYYGGLASVPVIEVAANGRIMSVSNSSSSSSFTVEGNTGSSLFSGGKLRFEGGSPGIRTVQSSNGTNTTVTFVLDNSVITPSRLANNGFTVTLDENGRLLFPNAQSLYAGRNPGQNYIVLVPNTATGLTGIQFYEGPNSSGAETFSESKISFYTDVANTGHIWTFDKSGSTTFGDGTKLTDAYNDNGTSLRASPDKLYILLASNTLQQYVQVDDNAVYIGTNYGVNDKSWEFGKNGTLSFPDNTGQSTAFTGTAIDQVARDLANNSSSGSAVDQYARNTANSSITGSAIDQYARNTANTDVTNVSLAGSSIGSSTQIPVIGYAANGRIISAGVASPQIGTGSVRGVVQLNDSVSSTSGVSSSNAATPLAVKTAYDYAQLSFTQANTSTTLAQAAFNKANNSITADQYARDTANTATNNITILQGVNASQNTDISTLYATNLTQNNSITILQGVDNTQNTRITSADDLARSAFGQANAAFTQANVGATFVNTGGTVTGNVLFTKDLAVTGNLYILGNTTSINTTSFIVQDPMIILGVGNYTTDILDIGFAGHYNNGTNAHAGLIRDSEVKEFFVFDGYTPELDSNNNIDINNASFNKANLNAGVFKGNLIGTNVTVNGLSLYNYTTSGYDKANSANVLAQASFDVANSAASNTIYTQGVDATQNTNITAVNTYATSAYSKANSANVLAQSAFDKANSAALASIDQYARDTSNTATSNITILQGVNLTQNTNITAVNTFTGSSYDKANSASVIAQEAFNKANTDVTNISVSGSSVGSSTQIPVITYAANGRITSAGVASPQTATGSLKGIVQVSDSTSSTDGASSSNAASPLAVKTTYDYAQAAFNTANNNAFNIVYAQGVNDTQNTNIASINTYSYAAFAAANNRVLKTGDTITGTLDITSNVVSTKPNTGSLLVTGGVGVSDSLYVGNRIGFSNTSNVSMVYQFYNAATNSLDTVFG